MARLNSNLSKLARDIPLAASAAMLQTAKDVLEISQQLVPVDQGLLKRSGGVGVIDSSTVVVGYGSAGSQREGVAIYQEYGTSKMPAQPYLRPAMMQAEPIFKVRLAEEGSKLA